MSASDGDNHHDAFEMDNAEESKVELDDGEGTAYVDHPVSFISAIGSISNCSRQQNHRPQQQDDYSNLPPQSVKEQEAGADHSGAVSNLEEALLTKPHEASRPGAHAMAPLPPEAGFSSFSPSTKYEMMMTARGNNSTATTAAAAAGTTLPGAHSSSPNNARLKYDRMHPAAAAPNAAMPPPSEAGPARVQYDKLHSTQGPARNGVVAPAETKPPPPMEPRFLDPTQNRNRNTIHAEIESVPKNTRTAPGPQFKDQARNVRNPLEQAVVTEEDESELPERSSIIAEEDDTEAGLATMVDRGVVVSPSRDSAPHLVQAELVTPEQRFNDPIDVAVELYEEKTRRKAWIAGVATLVIVVVLAVVLTRDQNGALDGNTSPPTVTPLLNPTGCDNATALELGAAAFAVLLDANSTPVSVDYPRLQTCGSAARLTDDQAGLWFLFETNATSGVRISTCTDTDDLNGNFDSQMLLFSGSCDRLTCLEGNDNEQKSVQTCGTEAGVSFQAFPSTSYYILVYGKVSDTVAHFAVQATKERVSPTNDECVGATSLQNDRWLNSTVLNADGPSVSEGPCVVNTAPTVWFLFESGQGEITVSTCSPGNSFGHNIFVFTGTCSTLECLYEVQTGSNVEESFACNGIVNSVKFLSKVASTYRIVVQIVTDLSLAQTQNAGLNATDRVEGDGREDFAILARSSTFALALNDECENASPLLPGSILQGSTSSATASESATQVCGDYVDLGYPDLWYVVQGSISNQTVLKATGCTGNIDVDTSNFHQQIFVYSGNDCSSLTCVDTSGEFSYEDGVCHNKATVSWIASEGENYYIRVFGSSAVYSFVGRFGILVEWTGPPVNDYCDGAIALETGEIFPSTTVGASADTEALCNVFNPFDNATEGVWFNVIGNNTRYTATTCTGTEMLYVDRDIHSRINVYSGESCLNLSCIGFNENSNENLNCNDGVSWVAEEGSPYWIRVFSVPRGGSFPIAVFPTPLNQVCEAAIMLKAGQAAVEGTTQGALAGPQDSYCGNNAIPSEGIPAVWYTVTGTDEDLTALTCKGNSTESFSLESQILVYNGTCGNLTCIDGNDFHYGSTNCSGTVSAVTWFAEAGTVYHVKVYGFFTVGTFELEIKIGKLQPVSTSLYPTFPPVPTYPPIPPPANDLCENAKLLSNELTAGSTNTATPSASLPSDLDVCGSGSLMDYRLSPDVWFQFNGTGGWHTVTTCTGLYSLDSSGFDSFVAIYSGTCSNLTCVTSNDDFFGTACNFANAVASWLTEEGETYLIRLSAAAEYSFGDYGIQIVDGKMEPLPAPENDNCVNGTILELDQVVEGTTNGATGTSGLQVCGPLTLPNKPSVPDVWYTVVGTGETLTVSTCTTGLDASSFDAILIVYTGNCTMGLTCVAGNNDDDRDSCDGPYAGVSWQSEVGVTYFVRFYSVFTWYVSTYNTFGVRAHSGTPD